MADLLDFFAQTHTPYLHARGQAGTQALIRQLSPKPGQQLLEYGFGTGQTLVELSIQFPEIKLFGVEKSANMLAVAQKRFQCCGMDQIQISLAVEGLPFPNHYFDSVYGESVLAIIPDEQLPAMLAELFRVLKPGGRLVCNESLWRPETPRPAINEINEQCLQWFGLVQASAEVPFLNDWEKLAAEVGFRLVFHQSLETLTPAVRLPFSITRLRSALFSRLGWLKGWFSPKLLRQKRTWKTGERVFDSYGQFLEGQLMVFQK